MDWFNSAAQMIPRWRANASAGRLAKQFLGEVLTVSANKYSQVRQ